MELMQQKGYPLPIARWLERAETICSGENGPGCHEAVSRLGDAIVYYLGAVAVAQYSQAYFLGQVELDPTLNRSLRSLRRVLPGQWLLWIARGLETVPESPVAWLHNWYTSRAGEEVSQGYETLRRAMVEQLGYTGEYGPRESVSPRLLLEMLDQYRIRRSKAGEEALPPEVEGRLSGALLRGLQALLESSAIFSEYQMYAPQERKLLVGSEARGPMPPMTPPGGSEAATILLYPPGELPDYTKRPKLQAERSPLFPLDPLLVYTECPQCGRFRVAALQEVVSGEGTHLGLDPECGHTFRAAG